MKRLILFLYGIILLGITFSIIFLSTLLYKASENATIKTYIFQYDNLAKQRVGALQNLNEISAIDMRNKLIKKYVAEYFAVIPDEKNVDKRQTIQRLSNIKAYEQWKNGEAKKIQEMSDKKQFRMVWVPDEGITSINMPDKYDYYSQIIPTPIYYSIHYELTTWDQSNNMAIEPHTEHGILNLEIQFKPGIWEEIVSYYKQDDKVKIKKMGLSEYLERGNDPVGLFKFEVTNIGSKN